MAGVWQSGMPGTPVHTMETYSMREIAESAHAVARDAAVPLTPRGLPHNR
jgi:hypothetical protein